MLPDFLSGVLFVDTWNTLMWALPLALLSFKWRFLWPMAAVGFAVGGENPLLLIIFGLSLSLIESRGTDLGQRYSLKNLLMVLFISLLILSFCFQAYELKNLFLFAFLPWVYFLPVLTLMDRDSGGRSIIVPFVIMTCLSFVFEVKSLLLLSGTILLFFHLAWHRRLPAHIKLLMLGLSASLSVYIALMGEYVLFALLLMFMFQQVIESRLWGAGKCLIRPGAIMTVIALLYCLLLSPSVSIGVLPLAMLWLAVFFSSQDQCRLCGLSLKCREMFLGSFARAFILLYALFPLLGKNILLGEMIWLVLFMLCLEASALMKIKPMRHSELPSQPCLN
ncbi:MAG: hypothetical protein HQL32_01955 [Planctomycetes bacterium]|nr:hypothetical protein [Planctomycetota bacterium]